MKVEGSTIQEAADNVATLRRFAPFRFGGAWYVAVLGGQAYALRSVRAIKTKALALGLSEVQFGKLP